MEKREAKLMSPFVRPDAHECGRHFAPMVQYRPSTSRRASRDVPPEPPGASSLLSRPTLSFPSL